MSADDLMNGEDRLLTPGEVAEIYAVSPKTVARWAASERIARIRTPGGQNRFRESDIRALLEGGPRGDQDPTPQP